MVVAPLHVRVDADVASLRGVRRSLSTWLSAASVGRAGDVVLAVHEAVANAVEHSGATEVEVLAAVLDGGVAPIVQVEVRDRGRWVEPATVATTDRGRGFGIMRALMDHVDVHRTPEGTSVVLRRGAR